MSLGQKYCLAPVGVGGDEVTTEDWRGAVQAEGSLLAVVAAQIGVEIVETEDIVHPTSGR